MAAAAQVGLFRADAVEHALHDCDVHCLAAVAGAHQRQHLRVEAEALHAAVLYEGERLQGLERRASEVQPMGVADAGDQPPVGVHYGDRADVHALGKAAARGADQRDVLWRIVHDR